MITFDPVTPAPLATRIVRVVLPLLLCFAYLAFRAYPAAEGRIPLAEAVVMGVVLMSLAMITCIALGDLIYPATPRARRRATSEELEITAVHAPIADADTVVARSCAEEIARLDALIGYAGELPRKWGTETLSARNAVLARALFEDTQPYDLLTHEFHPEHHTPPGGIRVIDDGSDTLIPGYPNQIADDPEVLARVVREQVELDAPTALHVLRGELYDAPDTGRHHRDED